MAYLDTLSILLARLAAWCLFLIGLMLGYEVTARYFFNSPTIWAEEISRLVMVWAVFIGASTMIRHDEHIRVKILVDRLSPRHQWLVRITTLLLLAGLAMLICWNGIPTVLDSFERGRSTGSMIDIPSWWMQAAVPLGFALITVQAVAQLMVVWKAGPDRAQLQRRDSRELL